jgi:hypothetical protein
MSSMEEDLIVALGSQGTASLAIFTKLLRALVSKGILREIDVIAILDAAAESAEKAPDELGGKYSTSVGESIRQMMDDFSGSPPNPAKRH